MIPDFDIHGVLPPIRPGDPGHSPDRAPYASEMLAFCQRFGGTPERRAVLIGLLDLRAALLAAGIVEGFQWLDGSFAEDVERLRGRPPEDIDVVTFAVLGDASAQRARLQAAPGLFDSGACRSRFRVDHYIVGADRGVDEALGRAVAYWYSLWAHQRVTQRWKGFVSVSLQSNDALARRWIDQQSTLGGGAP